MVDHKCETPKTTFILDNLQAFLNQNFDSRRLPPREISRICNSRRKVIQIKVGPYLEPSWTKFLKVS